MPFCELRGINVRFSGLVALDSVDVTVNHGEIVGLIGPNGAGKTTLFNCISGTVRPQSGRIIFDGRDITDAQPHLRARLGIGRTFQTVRLFPRMTVRQNLLVGCHVAMRTGLVSDGLRLPRSRSAMRQADDVVDEVLRFLSLERIGGRRAGELPLGQQRLVEIGRALTTRPTLLLLDEATSGIGKSETGELVDLLRSVRATYRLSLLVVEHDVSLVMDLCDFVYVLNFGTVLAAGRPQCVRTDPAVIEAYLGHVENTAELTQAAAAEPVGAR